MKNEVNKLKDLESKGIINKESVKLLDDYSQRLTANNVPIIYNLRHLRKLLNIKKIDQHKFFGPEREFSYKVFYIPKRSGGFRKIESPSQELELMQKWIKIHILEKFTISNSAKGFKKGSSIVNNANCHCNKKYVLNMDVLNFFPSIKYSKIFKLFNYIGYNKEVCHLLTQLCTNGDNVLPQGAPTSPIISNLVNFRLDKRLYCLAKSIGGDYTRYADDITISSNIRLEKYVKIVKVILKDEGYNINTKKTRIKNSGQKQEVTGLIVNRKIAVDKKITKELNQAIYFIKRFGLLDHMKRINCDRTKYKEHLFGLAYFVKMVEPNKGVKYLKELNNLSWLY